MNRNVDLIHLPSCSVKKDDHPNRADFEKKMPDYCI